MQNTIEEFFDQDPIAGEQAKNELIKHGEESLDLVVAQFGKVSISLQLETRLGDLFGYFGNASLSRLMAIFEKGSWGTMVMASPCFSQLPHEPAGGYLMKFVSSGEIDKERLAIEAIGYLGSPEWSFKLRDKLTNNDGYDWEKLSHYLFVTFFRIAIKASKQDEINSSLFYIEEFYKLAGAEKFKRLWGNHWYSMEIIFSDFKPVSADNIMARWLKHKEPFFRELGAKALGWMRLNRSVKILKQMALSVSETDNVVRECAHSLAMIDSTESAKALQAIYHATKKTSDIYKSIALDMAIALGRVTDKEFIETNYIELISMGEEIEAHTYYNIGLLGFDESMWVEAINSDDYIVRASIAPVYARRKGHLAIPKLLQMEREASHEIEKALILSALMVAGYTTKKEEFLQVIYALNKAYSLRMIRYVWKREMVFSLRLVEGTHSAIWERMAGVDMSRVLQEIAELENSLSNKPGAASQSTIAEKEVADTTKNKQSKEVFISYSWGGESETVVDAIYDKLTGRGLNIIRDKINLGYKGNIKQFMKAIGKGKYVIVVVSDKYLKSENCMFEMLEIKNKGDVYGRVFPIVLSDAKIYKQTERIDYLIYWDKEIEQLSIKIKELRSPAGTGRFIEALDEYNDIRRIMDEITDLLKEMNTLTPDIHKDSDFSILIEEIGKAMAADNR